MPDEPTHVPAAERAIVFVDISGSSLMYAERGDTIAFGLTATCLKLMNEHVQRAGGRVIKAVGDGILAVFETAAAALNAAVGIMEAVNQPDTTLHREGIHVRTGISYGRTFLAGDDVYGDVVNVAARLVSHAGPDEIVLSGRAYEELPEALRESSRLIDQVVLRGRPSWVLVYQYLWKHEDITLAVNVRDRVPCGALNVTYGSRVFVIGPERPKLRIGRAPDNDIAIEENLVSRYHAEISLRGDKFFLCDLSTNGTYLCTDADEKIRLSREDVMLGSGGCIFVGSEAAPPIRYCAAVKS